MLKHSMFSRTVDCFQFLICRYCDLKNQRWVKKGAFIFHRGQNVRSIETIKTIDSSLHYGYCYQCFIFASTDLSLSQR